MENLPPNNNINQLVNPNAIVIVSGFPADMEILNFSDSHILLNLARRSWCPKTDLLTITGPDALATIYLTALKFLQSAHPLHPPYPPYHPVHSSDTDFLGKLIKTIASAPSDPITIPPYFKRFNLEGKN